MQTLELVIFQTVLDISDEVVVAQASKLTPILADMPGFINRYFAQGENGQWIDAVIWDSKENALAAAKAVIDIPEAKPFFSLINQETVNLRHAAIETSAR